jgi:RNA polymerase sigma factor (sigma-70 family)
MKAMESSNPKVYIVDDDEAVRESLSLLLESVGQDNQTYPGANEFLTEFNSAMAGCLVLDIRMPSMTGLELQRQLNQLHSKLPIIFVTGHGDVPMAVEAMQHGAVDFIQKPYRDQDLLDKINLALSMNEEQRDTHKELQTIRGRLSSLTPREREVLDMMVEGFANKVIAIELGISQRTVEIHRARVMEKMKTHSLAQLVRMVLQVHNEGIGAS